MMIKCEMYAIMMQMTVGVASNQHVKQSIEKSAHKVKYGHVLELETYIRALKQRLDDDEPGYEQFKWKYHL